MKEKVSAARNSQEFSALVERARTGDQDAFTALYEATSQELYRTVHSMVRSDELTLDIQQDAYVYAFTHLEQLSDPEKFRPWLRAIAVNRTRSVLRKQTPVLFSELEDGDGPGLPELADESPDSSPELKLEQKENARYVREILDSLTTGQRMLVGMYYYEQLPVGKIAEDLGVSPGTVKTQLFRSRKKIESAVKRLEERGVKLYGLAPLPFLLALLKRLEPAAKAGRAALSGALTKSGVTTAGSTAGEAAAVTGAGFGAGAGAAGMKVMAVHVGRRFFQTAGGRVALALLAAAAVGSGVLTYGWAKDKLLIGDVRPTEPIRIQYSVEPPADSEEDLSTEPTLNTEVHTNEPDTPEGPILYTTEPPQPQEPSSSVDSSDSEDPIDAADFPAPEDPAATQPVNPSPTPTEFPDTGSEAAEAPRILGWRWQSMDRDSDRSEVESVWEVDLSIYRRLARSLVVTVQGSDVPEIWTDRPDIIDVDYWHVYTGLSGNNPAGDGITEYRWSLYPNNPGTAHVYCGLNGDTVCSTTVIVPEAGLLGFTTTITQDLWPGEDWRNLSDCIVGSKYQVRVIVEGSSSLEIIADDGKVVELTPLQTYTGNAWPTVVYSLTANIVGAGDANLSIKIDGEIKENYHIHASEDEGGWYDSWEDLTP